MLEREQSIHLQSDKRKFPGKQLFLKPQRLLYLFISFGLSDQPDHQIGEKNILSIVVVTLSIKYSFVGC